MTMSSVDALIEEMCPRNASGWVPSVQAQKIVAELRKTPEGQEALAAWLDRRAEGVIRQQVMHRRPRNTTTRGERMVATIDAWAKQHSCPGNVVKTAADMTQNDHLYVSESHGMRAKTAHMLAAFHEAVARRLEPGQTTKDVMDAESYQRLYESIT